MNHLGTVELFTSRLKLRRLRKEDAHEIFYGLRNQEEFLYYANKQKVSLEEHIKALENIDDKYNNLDYYNWIIDKEATCCEEGKKHIECLECKKVVKEEIIPTTGTEEETAPIATNPPTTPAAIPAPTAIPPTTKPILAKASAT